MIPGRSPGDEATDRAIMAAEAEMFSGHSHSSSQARPPKLGINSNIYSLYQTKQLQSPAPTSSSLHSAGSGYSDLNAGDRLGAASPDAVSRAHQAPVTGDSDRARAGAACSQETLYTACMQVHMLTKK